VVIERRMQVGEIVGVLRGREPARDDPVLQLACGHFSSSPLLFVGQMLAQRKILSIGQKIDELIDFIAYKLDKSAHIYQLSPLVFR